MEPEEKPKPKKKKTPHTNFRFSVEQKQVLRKRAEESRLSMAEYVRRASLGRVIVSKADMAMVAELRRLGGLLKQTHTLTGGAYAGTTGAILSKIQEVIRGMAK